MTSLTKVIAATALIAGLSGSAVFAAATAPTPTPDAAAAVETKTPDAALPDTQGPGQHHFVDRLFKRLDPQNTGTITLDQVLARRDKLFDKIDANKDGVLDKAELTAYFGTRGSGIVDRILKKYDAGNTGKISKADFEKPAKKRFALLDLNDDGRITKDEAERAMPIPGFDGTAHPHRHMMDHMRGPQHRMQPEGDRKAL